MAQLFKYQGTLDTLRKDLALKVSQRDDLDRQIAGLRQSVTGLLRLKDASFDDDEPPQADASAEAAAEAVASVLEVFGPSKLTESCRSVVRSAKEPMTAGDVRRELEVMGFDFSKYESNPLSSIHTTLKRDRAIRSFKNMDGRTVYEFQRSVPPPNSLSAMINRINTPRDSVSGIIEKLNKSGGDEK